MGNKNNGLTNDESLTNAFDLRKKHVLTSMKGKNDIIMMIFKLGVYTMMLRLVHSNYNLMQPPCTI